MQISLNGQSKQQLMTLPATKRTRALTEIARKLFSRRCDANAATCHRTLIDVLEPRLLFSADHPIGLLILANDSAAFGHKPNEADANSYMHAMSTALTDRICIEPSNQLGDTEQKDKELCTQSNGVHSNTVEQEIHVTEHPLNDSGNLNLILNDVINTQKTIYVTTEIDELSNSDKSSFESFNNDLAGNGSVSLREAILVANNDESIERIVLPNGQYFLTIDLINGLDDNEGLLGDLDIRGSYTIEGEDENNTIISQSVVGSRVFELHTGSSAFSNLTIQNGSVGNADENSGGGVFIGSQGYASFDTVIFYNNRAEFDGGAVAIEGTADIDALVATFNNVQVINNRADLGAGILIENSASVIISDSHFSENNAIRGGAVFSHGLTDVLISNSTFYNNSVVDDGGAIVAEGNMSILNSEFELNKAISGMDNQDTRGGALFADYFANVLVEHSLFKSNYATSDGGAIHNHGDITITDSALVENTAERRGAGLHNNGSATLIRDTIWGNDLQSNGADFARGSGVFSTGIAELNMSYSVIANNTSSSFGGGMVFFGNGVISDSVITKNTSTAGASGVGFDPVDNNKTIKIFNTIITENLLNGIDDDVTAYSDNLIKSLGFNFISDATSIDIALLSSDITNKYLSGYEITLENDRDPRLVLESPDTTIYSGSVAGIGNTSIDGKTIGSVPTIGAFSTIYQHGLVFWSDDDDDGESEIYRSDPNFTYSQKIISDIYQPLDIEVDIVNSRVFWLDPQDYAIKSANYDGSDIKTERLVNLNAVAFTLDINNARIFVATEGSSSQIILYSENDIYDNTDESQRVGTIVNLAEGNIADVELDTTNNILYWSETGDTIESKIWSLGTNEITEEQSSPVATIFASGSSFINNPYALAINETEGRVFWSEPDMDLLVQHIEGGTEPITTSVGFLVSPSGLAYDYHNDRLITSENQSIYWTNSSFDSVQTLQDAADSAEHMAFSSIQADVQTTEPVAPTETVNTGLSLLKGETRLLSNTELSVEDNDSKSAWIEFRLTNTPSDIKIYRNSFDVTSKSFSQKDIDMGRIWIRHIKSDITNYNTFNETLDFSVSNKHGNFSQVYFDVTASNENDSPVITSTDTFSVFENSSSVGVVTVEDNNIPEDVLGFSIIGGEDYELFNIDSLGNLNFNTIPNFENPNDYDTDNEYQIEIQVDDGQGGVATQLISVTIQNENEDPEFVSNGVYSVDENSAHVGVVYAIDIDDPDNTITYSLSGGTDEAQFSINDVGELSFVNLPDFENPLDENTNNNYLVEVNAENINGGIQKQNIIVSVIDVNEPPSFSNPFSFTLEENIATVAEITAIDMDIPANSLTYSISGGDDSALFTLDPNNILNFLDAPDYDNPSDNNNDNTYSIELLVNDNEGKIAVQTYTISVTDINEAPIFISATEFQIHENIDQAGRLLAIDNDLPADSLTFSITGGDDSSLFTIDSNGYLKFNDIPNYENPTDYDRNNQYKVSVNVDDGEGATSFQDIIVEVLDINENPIIDPRATFTIIENITEVGLVYATDEDTPDSTLSYTLTGGEDYSLFDINSNGMLSFLAPPDFENTNDSNGDNIYEIDVKVQDEQGGGSTQSYTITIINENESPTILSHNSFILNENEVVVGPIIAIDYDDTEKPLNYSLIGGADSTLFSIDASGNLKFSSSADFEAPLDSNSDNNYLFKVQVEDDQGAYTTQDISVSVTDVNEHPVINSANTFTLIQNNTSIGEVVAVDYDNTESNLTYSIIGGSDKDLIDIDDNGNLSFNLAPDYFSPLDSNGDNQYDIEVEVKDNQGLTATQLVSVSVREENIAPMITSSNYFYLYENSDRVGQLDVEDLDAPPDSLVFSITGGSDKAIFSINDSGILKFNIPPDFDIPSDYDSNNNYIVDIKVDDGHGGTDTQTIFVDVVDINEPPIFTSNAMYLVPENRTPFLNISAMDEDVPKEILTYSLIEGLDSADFTIENDGKLRFSSKPNFELPSDSDSDNTYLVEIKVEDERGKSAIQALSITVTDINERPVFNSNNTFTIVENNLAVGQIVASDADITTDALNYSILTGEDSSHFDIDDNGNLRFLSPPDFDNPSDTNSDNQYILEIQVQDSQGATSRQSLTVKVIDINEDPIISSNGSSSVLENQNFSWKFDAYDNDIPLDTLTFSLIEGADSERFDIDTSGNLGLLMLPDFENPNDDNRDNVYAVEVEVRDGQGGSATQLFTVSVIDVNEKPEINSSNSFSILENNQTVGQIIAIDHDIPAETLSYSITNGHDSKHFDIDQNGNLTFLTAPDFDVPSDADSDNTYNLEIQVEDTNGGISRQLINITVVDVNENPVFNSNNLFSIFENNLEVGLINASDSDIPANTLLYSLKDSGDSSLFTIDTLGNIKFLVAPDYENPLDANKDNEYEVEVELRDGRGGFATRIFTITVVGVNELPQISSGESFTVSNNNSTVGYIEATDVDVPKDTLTYTIIDGEDSRHFTIDTRGQLSFITELDPDATVGENRKTVYKITVSVEDGNGGSDAQEVSVSFINNIEPPVQAAIPFTPVRIDIPTTDSSLLNQRPPPLEIVKQESIVSTNSVSDFLSAQLTEDSNDAVSSVSGETVTTSMNIDSLNSVNTTDEDTYSRAVLRNNVISDFFAGQENRQAMITESYISIDIFDDSVNIANLFLMAQQQDAEMFSNLSENFKKQRSEYLSQTDSSRDAAGSAVTVTSGLSIGYLLYMLRGGAIMSSMLTSLPAWRFVDPLPILSSMEGSLSSDEESLESIVRDSSNNN